MDRAYTLSHLGISKSFNSSLSEAARGGMSLRGRSCAWVVTRGISVVGLVSARQRSGPQSWEVTHLFLKPGAEGCLPDLLETISVWVGRRGAEKVFVRLLREDPLVDVAKHSGFFPRIPEVLYTSNPSLLKPVPRPAADNGQARFRRKSQSDEHDIFRLYNASTPPEVRYAIGMTFDQWRASREPTGGHQREFVLRTDERIKAWLGVTRRSRRCQMSITVHPDAEGRLPYIVHFGLHQMGRARVIYCMAGEYQVALQRALRDAGFEAVADYVTLVKSMAAAAKEEVRATATAPSV